jgi:hypothetical protein
VQNLGIFIEHLMRGAANRGKDGRLAKSTKTHYRNPRMRKPSWGCAPSLLAQNIAMITALTPRAIVVKARIFPSQIRSFANRNRHRPVSGRKA